jgi:hypothetical protein
MEKPMKKVGPCLLVLATVLASAHAQEKKEPKPLVVKALPPHPLDNVFRNAKSEKDVTDKLLDNDLFKRAIREALKAEEKARKSPKPVIGPTPEQVARQRFLEVLTGSGVVVVPKKPDPKPAK